MKTLGQSQRTWIKKPWAADDMIEKMDFKRKWKNVKTEEGNKRYQAPNNQLHRSTDTAREKCDELEE